MYKKSVQGWLKHLDFMILDVVCLWISFTLAFNMRHGSLDVLANSLYRDMMWSLALMDIVVIFFFDSLQSPQIFVGLNIAFSPLSVIIVCVAVGLKTANKGVLV